MSEIRILADEHVPIAVVNQLRAVGIDAVAVDEEGLKGRSDGEVLAYAVESNRAVLTSDQEDFMQLGRDEEHKGVVVVTKRLGIGETVREVMKLVDTLDAEAIEDTVQTIPWES